MGRKVFQDFAHVLCQKFLDTPSNRDLVNLAILGSGTLILAVTDGSATHNRLAIQPLPYAQTWLDWVTPQLAVHHVPRTELQVVELAVTYTVELTRKGGLGWLCARFDFACEGRVASPDREYRCSLKASKEWGLAPT
jgi:hypothetical protein